MWTFLFWEFMAVSWWLCCFRGVVTLEVNIVKRKWFFHFCGYSVGECCDLFVYVHEESVAFPSANFSNGIVWDPIDVHGHSAASAETV